MKKWIKFFGLSFFSHKYAREGVKRSYANVFFGFILALIFLWMGFVGGELLPFGVHYHNAPDFMATAQAVFANADESKRIVAEIENGVLKVKKYGEAYSESLFVNTFENEADRQNYSVNGYNIVIDTRPADILAEVEAYCVSNDGKNTVISYEEYLTLSDVAKLNFDFQLKYTGNVLELDDATVESYRAYVDGLSDENKSATQKLESDLAENQITKAEYQRGIYELYFANYYPEITAYESTSIVPLLRNYYHQQYIEENAKNYLFIFDDYMTGFFTTRSGIEIPFFGFYSDVENGVIVAEGTDASQANGLVDAFIKDAFWAVWILYGYSYALNTISLVPYIIIMLMVVALMTYSVLKLRGVESLASLGGMCKAVGSFVWFSGIASAAVTVLISFFVPRSVVNALQLVLFFVVLMVRAILFAVQEGKWYAKQLERQVAQ